MPIRRPKPGGARGFVIGLDKSEISVSSDSRAKEQENPMPAEAIAFWVSLACIPVTRIGMFPLTH